MGSKALFAAFSWLTISGTLAVNGFAFKDQGFPGSASRLYRQAVGAVYASAAPYGAYSFQVPTVVQQAASSSSTPLKQGLQNANAYLKDSYGNRFVEALQSMKALPFKPFPQRYVQLQELPAHFAQPLTASPAHFQNQYQKGMPQVVLGSHYQLPLQSASPTPIHQQFSFPHSGVYAGSYKNIAPAVYSYGPQFGSVIHVPVRSSPPPQDTDNVSSTQEFQQSVSENQEHPFTPQQLKSHKTVAYANTNTHSNEGHHYVTDEPKFQRLEETYSEEETPPPATARPVAHKLTTRQKVSVTKEIPVSTVVNGKKTVVNVEVKPPIPLLDLHLLEPLTFENPLVPQVQHFLPRIHEATYHKFTDFNEDEDKKYLKESSGHKTKHNGNRIIKGKPKKPTKKQRYPEVEINDEYVPAATARPTVTIKGNNEAPEITYEINLPNYKETYKEKAVKYNKETNSEPVHYTYGTNTRKEPVTYSFSHSSKEPLHIQEIHYEGKGKGPKHLIHNFTPEEQNRETEKTKLEDSRESSEHSDDFAPQRSPHREHTEHHSLEQEPPKSTNHYVPEHREQEYYHKPHSEKHHKLQHIEKDYYQNPIPNKQHKHHHGGQENRHTTSSKSQHQNYHTPHSESHQHTVNHKVHPGKQQPHQSLEAIPYQPVAQYEEDITVSAHIKVDPNQHVQNSNSETPQKPRQTHAPHHHARPSNSPTHYSETDSKPHRETSTSHITEKTKQVYPKEKRPEQDESFAEELMKSMFAKQEDNEKDFENAYKNAAFGFPAYDKSSADYEKDIYNPESYGVPAEHSAYDADHAPFAEYQAHNDNFPKEMRLSYKDDVDKTKEDYFLDYSISKPESLIDRHKNKVGYYKLYKNQKPEKYEAHEDKKETQHKNAKLTAIPYSYYPVQGDMKKFFAQYKMPPYASPAPLFFEYDYSKGSSVKPKDNSAHATRPFQRYKNTAFVEPQFQYGFEPVALPRLLDSELAAMASHDSPESEKPGTRRKIYKENFYVEKTMSKAGLNS